MTTATMTLGGFLEARLAEDEAAARAATESSGAPVWSVGHGGEYVFPDPPPGNSYVAVGPWGGGIGVPAEHIARHDPARVLREVEAKRRIVAQWQQLNCTIEPLRLTVENPAEAAQHGGRAALAEVLRALASVYDDHPDFCEEWRP